MTVSENTVNKAENEWIYRICPVFFNDWKNVYMADIATSNFKGLGNKKFWTDSNVYRII